MKFATFSQYLQRLEATPKRLEITAILAEMIEKLSAEEVEQAVYLSLGYLKAPYENPKFNIAEKMMVRILSKTYGETTDEITKIYARTGDLGDTAYELANDKKTTTLEVTAVHIKLMEIALTGGTGSQEQKVNKSSELLTSLDATSAKYVTRIILGTTRLGFTELTILAALAKITGTDTKKIETAYNAHPDIGLIAKLLKQHGLAGISKVGVEIGVPILSQRCQRLSGPEETLQKMKTVWAEFKLDGTRVELHMDKTKEVIGQNDLFSSTRDKNVFIKTFTRNLEESTYQYPEILDSVAEQIDAESVILDGEAIGHNKETGKYIPFQETIQRKRKHGVAEMAKEIPLKYIVFDLLYLNGKALMGLPLRTRRAHLQKIVKPGKTLEISEYIETSDVEVLADYFELAKEKNLEGLVVKNPESEYKAGARSFAWIKLKKADEKLLQDSVDCVILGYYNGRGVRSQFGVGVFLAGVYDEKNNTYKTLTKVGTGLTEEDLKKIKLDADKIKVKDKPANVEVDKMLYPDVWVTPKIVVEISGDEISKSPSHTAGYALRFPRLLNFRPDKKATDTTTVQEIVRLYKLQQKAYHK